MAKHPEVIDLLSSDDENEESSKPKYAERNYQKDNHSINDESVDLSASPPSKANEMIEKSPNDREWACGECTFLNPSSSPRCEMCGIYSENGKAVSPRKRHSVARDANGVSKIPITGSSSSSGNSSKPSPDMHDVVDRIFELSRAVPSDADRKSCSSVNGAIITHTIKLDVASGSGESGTDYSDLSSVIGLSSAVRNKRSSLEPPITNIAKKGRLLSPSQNENEGKDEYPVHWNGTSYSCGGDTDS